MKHLSFRLLLAAGLLICGVSMAQTQTLWSQERTSPDSNQSSTNGKTVMLSGCLDRGAGANEYSIRAAGASSQELKSDSVDLSGFLQKTVVIVGVQSDDPNAPVNVIYLRFVSNACESWH